MNYIVTKNPTFFEAIGQYNYCTFEEMGEMLTKGIAVDTETTGLNAQDDKIFAVQIGTGKDNFLMDLQEYKDKKKQQGLGTVLPYLEGRHLVFHNGLFDLGFLMKGGFVPDESLIWDTMLASKLLYNGYPNWFLHKFDAVMLRELGVKYDKTEQKNIHRVKLSTKEAIQYCFNDVDRLKELHETLYAKLRAYGGHHTYNLNRQDLCPLAYMELCGLPTSEEWWKRKMEGDLVRLKETERIVIEYIYDKIEKERVVQMGLFSSAKEIYSNPKSPKQMIPIFKKLGISTETDDKGKGKAKGAKKDSIAEDVISLSPHEFVKIWLDYKEAQHTISNFGNNVLVKIRDGRVHPKFNPTIDTSRISCKKEGDINSLNIPANKETRSCFRANQGFAMVVCDYEGQETVILADLSLDDTMVKSVTDGLDLHCAFARMVFPELEGLTDDEIKKDHKEKRNFVKSPRFAFSYGGSGMTVHLASGMPLAQAEDLEKKFKELHAGVYEWGKNELEKAVSTGYIESVDGFRLHLPDYEEFREMKRKFDGLNREFWTKYKDGKTQFLALQESKEKCLGYEITRWETYDIYMEWKGFMGKYFSKRGEYQRLCLNNPIQTRAAHQTKKALVLLWKHIRERGHLWEARLANSPYDEIVMEVKEELAEEYKIKVGEFMRDAGTSYLTSGLFKMKADANIGPSWYDAK